MALAAVAMGFVACDTKEWTLPEGEETEPEVVYAGITLSIPEVSDISVGSASFASVITGTYTDNDSVSACFEYAYSQDMTAAIEVPAEIIDDTLMYADCSTLYKKNVYYVRAKFVHKNGEVAKSEVATFTTLEPQPITRENLDGAVYKAKGVADYWGDVFDFAITLRMGEGDTVYVCDCDPYFVRSGWVWKNGVNYMTGILTISDDQKSATIAVENYQMLGSGDFMYILMDDEMEDLTEPVIELSSMAYTMTLNFGLFGVYTEEGGGWYELFEGPLELAR